MAMIDTGQIGVNQNKNNRRMSDPNRCAKIPKSYGSSNLRKSKPISKMQK